MINEVDCIDAYYKQINAFRDSYPVRVASGVVEVQEFPVPLFHVEPIPVAMGVGEGVLAWAERFWTGLPDEGKYRQLDLGLVFKEDDWAFNKHRNWMLDRQAFWNKRAFYTQPFAEEVIMIGEQYKTAYGLRMMDAVIAQQKKEVRLTVERLVSKCFSLVSPLTTEREAEDCLFMHRVGAFGKVGVLDTKVQQHLGGNASPNLFRLPLNSENKLDVAQLKGTAIDPTVQYLQLGEYLLPAPLFVRAAKVIRVYALREDGALDLGLYLDADPMVVSLDTAAMLCHTPGFDHGAAMINFSECAQSTFERSWNKNIIHFHSGWSIAAQLHVRLDLDPYDITITPEMARFVAQQEGCAVEAVNGRSSDLTGFPIVNAACRPELRIRVLDEEGLMPHFGLSPLVTELMARDHDGDAPNLHRAKHRVCDGIKSLLSRKDNQNG